MGPAAAHASERRLGQALTGTLSARVWVVSRGPERSSRRRRESERQQRLPRAVEAGRLKHARVHEPAHPAVAVRWVRVVVEAADSGEDLAASKIPLLDLVVEAFGVCAEAVEVVAKAPLDGVEPSLLWIVAGVDTALLDQIVLELFENQRLEVA